MSDQNLYRLVMSLVAALFLWFSPPSIRGSLLAAGFAGAALIVALFRRYRELEVFQSLLHKTFKKRATSLTVERLHLTLLMEFLTLVALVLLIGQLLFFLIAALAFSWLIYRREEYDLVKILPAFTIERNRKNILLEHAVAVNQWYWLFSILIAVILSIVMLKYPYQHMQWLRMLICVGIAVNSLGAFIELNNIFRLKRLR